MGVAVREYQTDVGPADYVLFVDKKPVGIIEAKEENKGFQLTQVEDQSTEYAPERIFIEKRKIPKYHQLIRRAIINNHTTKHLQRIQREIVISLDEIRKQLT